MKKFCSTCGNQLELSQRFCSQCGAVNPFFVSTFSFLSDQSDELERLRLEKERIDKELAEREEKQAEFRKQEQLRKESEETERMKLENQEKEKLAKEQQERDRIEQGLKQELLKVKEETELYKKETTDWVKEVKQGLQQIEEDNKRLKEDVANLNRAGLVERNLILSAETEASTIGRGSKRMVVSLLVILLGLTSVLAFFYFTTRYDSNPIETPAVKQEVMLTPMEELQRTESDTLLSNDGAGDTAFVETKSESLIPIVVAKTSATDVASVKPKAEFVLDEYRIKRDLVGQKISGCDIIIGNASEIEQINNLVLVEKLTTGNLRYRFTASIAQGSEAFTASPYIYYTSGGGFIKVDGTNCE